MIASCFQRTILPIFTLVLAAAAAEPPIAKPESFSMSSERLDRINVWPRGLVHQQAVGTMGRQDSRPMALKALFDLASMTN